MIKELAIGPHLKVEIDALFKIKDHLARLEEVSHRFKNPKKVVEDPFLAAGELHTMSTAALTLLYVAWSSGLDANMKPQEFADKVKDMCQKALSRGTDIMKLIREP